jgi:hypothetical protein
MGDPINLPNVTFNANDYAANSLAARDAKVVTGGTGAKTLTRLQDLDFDRSGKVDAAEVIAYTQADMTKFDANNNNQLDPEEFKQFKLTMGGLESYKDHKSEAMADFDTHMTTFLTQVTNQQPQVASFTAQALMRGYQSNQPKDPRDMGYDDGGPSNTQYKGPIVPSDAAGLKAFIEGELADPVKRENFMKALANGMGNIGNRVPTSIRMAAADAIDVLKPTKNDGVTGLLNTVGKANAARMKAMNGTTPEATALKLATTDRPGALKDLTPKQYLTSTPPAGDKSAVTTSLTDFKAKIASDFAPLLLVCPDAPTFVTKVREAYPEATKGMDDAYLTKMFGFMSGSGITAADIKPAATSKGAIYQLQDFTNKLDPTLGKQVLQNEGKIDDKYGYRTSDAFADFSSRMTVRVTKDPYAGQFQVTFNAGAKVASGDYRIMNGLGQGTNVSGTTQVQD